jgi:aspartate-semialdehyde dehydrogenase
VQQVVDGQPVTREVYPHQIAFNVLPHVDSFLPNGYTKEEMKMENEGRKIMHHPTFRASVTCVRVPVYRAHSVAITAEFDRPASVEAAREVCARRPGSTWWIIRRKRSIPCPLRGGKGQLPGRPAPARLRHGERSLLLGVREISS